MHVQYRMWGLLCLRCLARALIATALVSGSAGGQAPGARPGPAAVHCDKRLKKWIKLSHPVLRPIDRYRHDLLMISSDINTRACPWGLVKNQERALTIFQLGEDAQ